MKHKIILKPSYFFLIYKVLKDFDVVANFHCQLCSVKVHPCYLSTHINNL